MLATIQEWFSSNQVLAAKVFGILVVAFVLHFVIQRFLMGLKKQFDKTANPWDNILAESLAKPAAYLIAVAGLGIAISMVNQGQENTLLANLLQFQNILILVIVAWFAVRFVKLAEQNFIDNLDDPHERTTVEALAKLVRLAVIITAGLMAMQTMGYSIEGVLAFGGVGGIAIGFAAKDLLSNFFGGLMIYLDRPFVVGDWIRSPDKSIEGTVEQIGWRLTLIRTFDKRPLYVPNSVFTSIAIENPSRMLNRRIKETIGIRYDDAANMDVIIKDVKAMLQEHPEIDTNQTLIVNFNSFAPSSLDFFIYTFTKTTDWVRFHEIKQDVLLKVLAVIESHDCEVAFPTSTLHLYQEGDGQTIKQA